MRIVQLHKLEYKYLAILCSYLDWFNQSAARTTLLYPLCFPCLMKKSSWVINNNLDVLVRSFPEYFYELKTLLVITADTLSKEHIKCNLFYEPILKLWSVNNLPCPGFVSYTGKQINKSFSNF